MLRHSSSVSPANGSSINSTWKISRRDCFRNPQILCRSANGNVAGWWFQNGVKPGDMRGDDAFFHVSFRIGEQPV